MSERDMKIVHLREAMRTAEQLAKEHDWEESLYHMDEAKLICQALEKEDRLGSCRPDWSEPGHRKPFQ